MTRTELLKKYPNASESFIRRNTEEFAQAQPELLKSKHNVVSEMTGTSRECGTRPEQTGGSGFVSLLAEKPVEAALNFKPTIAKSTDEAKLNKTEKARLEYLRRLPHIKCLHIQAVTVKLADDCRLTPDFFYFDEQQERLVAEDVKGFQREDALIKMKVAARMFPEFSFQIVFKNKSEWIIKPVKP